MIEEKKRISIQEMKKHAWYNKTLPARLQHAELNLLEEQQRLEAHIANRQLDQVIPSLCWLALSWPGMFMYSLDCRTHSYSFIPESF